MDDALIHAVWRDTHRRHSFIRLTSYDDGWYSAVRCTEEGAQVQGTGSVFFLPPSHIGKRYALVKAPPAPKEADYPLNGYSSATLAHKLSLERLMTLRRMQQSRRKLDILGRAERAIEIMREEQRKNDLATLLRG